MLIAVPSDIDNATHVANTVGSVCRCVAGDRGVVEATIPDPTSGAWSTTKLSPAMLQRITSLPIWDVAVHTESRARLRFAVYANAVDDPQVQAAVRYLNVTSSGRQWVANLYSNVFRAERELGLSGPQMSPPP